MRAEDRWRLEPWKYEDTLPSRAELFDPCDVPEELKKERELPEWCKCMPWDWDDYDTVPPACHTFNDNGKGFCRNCEHGEDCHTKSKNELTSLKKENRKLMADIVKLSSQSSINNLIPEVIYQMMIRHASEYRETMTRKGV